jgi:hypothetical protein
VSHIQGGFKPLRWDAASEMDFSASCKAVVMSFKQPCQKQIDKSRVEQGLWREIEMLR